MSFYEKGTVRIRYQDFRFRLPATAHRRRRIEFHHGAGLIGSGNPFNPFKEFNGEYRFIAADLRNANGGQSSGPLEIDAVAMEAAMLAPNAEVSVFPWKEPKERIPLAVRQIRSLPPRASRPASV